MVDLIVVGHAAVTGAMFGVILTVQLVVYPQFLAVPDKAFSAYHAAHMRRISLVVGPLMLLELALAGALFLPAAGVPVLWAAIAAVLLVAIWALTGLVHVPQHDALSGRASEALKERLVSTNVWRTILWGLRAALAVWIAVQAA